MLAAGADAPSFQLGDLAGKQHALADLLAEGPVLVALYKISCPVCQMTLPHLERLSKGSLRVIGISQDDERGTAFFHQKFGATMAALLDREESGYPVSNAFGISHVPSLFLIEPDGVISLASAGFVKSDLEAIGRRAGVAAFLPGENVPEWKAG